MSASDTRLIHLSGCLSLPAAAVVAVLHLEHAGHRVHLDGDDVVVTRASGVPLDADDLDALRRWKPWVKLFLGYTPDDSHLYTDEAIQ